MKEIKAGLRGEASKVVVESDLASAYGNPGVDVLSSMTLMTLLEQACLDCLEGCLGPDQFTVGARMEMDHLAPTPPKFTVTARAEIKEVAGRKLVFSVQAHDGKDQVAKAVHVRYLLDKVRFMDSVAQKAVQGG